MNAPWTAGRPGARDPFAAFVCDEMTLGTLKVVCNDLGWPSEKVNKGGLRNAVQTLSVSASPTILFVDLSESGDPLNDINALAEVCEPGTVVIAAGEINDVRLYRDLIASGLQDYLLKPFSPDQFREAVAHAQAVLAAPKASEAAGNQRPHFTMGVIGTRGGVGASTIATSLAWAFSEREKRSSALLDLDVHFGTGALTMDLEPGRGLTDAIDNPARIDGLFIERAMVRANEKLSILSAEAPMSQPTLSDGTAFFQLTEEMRSAFEATVIDLPRHMVVQYPHLVADLQSIVVVSELTLAGARDMIRILSWLKSNAPQAQVIAAINSAGASSTPEISQRDFESSIERKADLILPYDAKATSTAAKLGKTIVDAAPSSKLGATLIDLSGMILGRIEAGADATAPAKVGKSGSLMDKVSNLKSMLKPKAKATPAAEPESVN